MEFVKKIITSRLFALAVLFTLMFSGLIGTLFRMQILEGDKYQDEYMQMTEQTVTTRASGETSTTGTATHWPTMS